jgi:hypothetical protein
MIRASLLAFLLALVACGPAARDNGDDTPGDDEPGPDASTCTPTQATETTCMNGFDEDCDGFADCMDLDCSGIDLCPVVGENCEVATPSAELALPDGNCTGIPPFGGTDAEIQAFLATCENLEATLTLTGFPAGATLTDTSNLIAVCVNMEHTWIRDLQIEAYCPDGQRVILSKFQGQDCPVVGAPCEVLLGMPNTADGGPPGTGWDYCWTPAATNPPMIDYSNVVGAPGTLPAGDYQPSEPFTNFMGCALNGDWRIRVIDGWGIDDGYIFESKLVFDGSLSDDCPIIE